MPKRRYIILFIAGMLLALLHNAQVHSAEHGQKSEQVSQTTKTKDELQHEIERLKLELNKERKIRKELQEQLDALTELEENINERETQDNNNLTQ